MSWSIEAGLLKLKDKISMPERYALVSALITGFLTHSFIFYNKVSYADDSRHYFNLGSTYASGRWGLGVIEKIRGILGLQNYSSSLINGVVSIILLAVFAMLLVRLLDIKRMLDAVLIGAYVVIFPTVTSTFAYMFTAPYYFFAALLMVLAAYLVGKSWWGMMSAAVMVCFGMGIYQAYFCVAASLFVVKLLVEAKDRRFLENIQNAIRYLISLVLGLIGYFVLNKVFLNVTDVELGNYQGISSMTELSQVDIFEGILGAYKSIVHLKETDFVGISHTGLIQDMYHLCFIITLVAVVSYLTFIYKKYEIWNTLYVGVLIAMMPLAVGLIFVMTASPGAYIHTLMIYSYVLIPIVPIMLLNVLEKEIRKELFQCAYVWVKNSAIIVMLVMILFYFRLDNLAYLKADYQQENAKAYFTVVLSEIKGTEGYSDEYPVVFLGNLDGMDWSIKTPWEFNEIQLQGYHTNMNQFISYFADVKFLVQHCGYSYSQPSDMQAIYESEYIRSMPCYPDDGAIQVVDDVVVVKFSNTY